MAQWRRVCRSFAYRPEKPLSFVNGRCLLLQDKDLHWMRMIGLSLSGLIGTSAILRGLSVQGWMWKSLFFSFAACCGLAAGNWRYMSKAEAESVYLLADGRHIEVHFLSFVSSTKKKYQIASIIDTSSNPMMEVIAENSARVVVSMKNGKHFRVDVKALIPDKQLLGAVLKGIDIDTSGSVEQGTKSEGHNSRTGKKNKY